MDNATFNTIIEAKIEEIRNTLVGKAKEYAADHDRLHNFAVTAKVRDQNLTQALAGMMVKHTVSVYDMINSGEAYSKALWDEKTGDHLVYLLLLQATIVEDGLVKREPGEINALYNKAQTSGKVLDVASLYPVEVNIPLEEWERELLHGPHHEGVSSLNDVAQKNINFKTVRGPISDEMQAQINLGIEHLEKERAETKSYSLNHQRAEARRQRVIKAQLMNIDGYSNETIADTLGVKDATLNKYLSEPPYLRELPSWQQELYRLPQEAYAEGGFDYDYPLSVQCSANDNEARLVYVTREERDLLDLRVKLAGNVTDTDHWKFIHRLRTNPDLAKGFNRRIPETIQVEVQEDPSGTPPVIFQTHDRAQLCLRVLKTAVVKKTKVSYADYIRICRNIGVSGAHAFDGAEGVGWTNLFGTTIVKLDHGGYTLALPGMVELS